MIQGLEIQQKFVIEQVKFIVEPEKNTASRKYLSSTITREQLHALTENQVRDLINTHLLNLSDKKVESVMHPHLDPELSQAFQGCLLIGSGAREIASDKDYLTHNGKKINQVTGLRKRRYKESEPESDLEFLVPQNRLTNIQTWLEENAHTTICGNAGNLYYHFEQRSWPYHISANIIPRVLNIEQGIKYMITTAPTPAHATCFIINPEGLLEVLPFGPKSGENGYFTMPGNRFSYEGIETYQSMWNPNSVLFFEKNETPASLIKRFTIGIFQEPGLYEWFLNWNDIETWIPFKAFLMQRQGFTPHEARSICDCFVKNFHHFNADAVSIFGGQDEVFAVFLEESGILDEVNNAAVLTNNDFVLEVTSFLKEKALERKPSIKPRKRLLNFITG